MSKQQVSPENESDAPDEGEAPQATRPEELEEALQGKDKRIEELLDRLAYLQADLENLQKRMDKERAELVRMASEGLIRRLLPVLEEFEMALEGLRDREDAWVGGLRMVYENLLQVLREEGLQVIHPEAEPFDPYLHEAVESVEGDESGQVVEVRKKGYRLAQRVLRPAHVVVSKKEGEQDG